MERLGVSGVLVLLFAVIHAAVHDTPSGPKLDWKDSNVLQIECRIPYYTAWTEQWDAPVDLQVSFKGTGAYDSLEVVANMTSSAATPKTYGRFKDVDTMVRAEGRKIAEADGKCKNCRSLFVLLPMTPKFSLYGAYYCHAMYIKGHAGGKVQYQVQVDETFVLKSKTKTDGALTVKSMTAHMINISYSSHRMNAKVTISRKLVDADSCPVNGATADILFETVKENTPVLYDNDGTLAVFNFSSQTSEGQSTWTLFVQTGVFCYPKCVYSCEVNGQKCEGKLGTAAAESNCDTSKSTETGLGVGFGISIFVCILLGGTLAYSISQKRQQYKVSANQEEVDTNQEEVDTSQEEVDTNQEEVDTNQEEVDTNQEEVDTSQEEVDTNQEEVDTNQEEVDTNQEEVDTNQEEVDTNQEEVCASQGGSQSSSTGNAMSQNENQETDLNVHDQEERQPLNSEQT